MEATAFDTNVQLAPDLLRIRAPNPSAFTEAGTNTYILGKVAPCVIDPGPAIDSHLMAILVELRGRSPSAILVTHGHLDHSALAPALAARTGAPILAFGDARAGLRPSCRELDSGWGVDLLFAPDRHLANDEPIQGEDWRLVARHTPGHMGNHLCFDDGRRLFSGDHAMGFTTSLVSPPEGDMGDYMASLERLLRLGPRTLLPGHGAPVPDGQKRLQELLAHRATREEQVLASLAGGPRTVTEIAHALYPDASDTVRRASRRNVLAHLLYLARRGLVASDSLATEDTFFHRVD
jgi:hydroxyacylglutathione hydrolase